jgi:serine/threonine-protein kinase
LDTLAGLHAAHELKDDNDRHLNLVHRDVSPQNILVGINGTARITDFGVARAATRLSSTRSGQLKGKLAYMAPEQARGGMIDRRADVFAIGTVLWEVLADKRLFKGEGEADTLNRVLFEPIPRLREIAPDVHPALETVTMKSLERDPQRRFASAAVFADELEKAARAIHALASVREVAEYVQKVMGQEIAQQREVVRNWLAQSEPSRTELDHQDIIVGAPNSPSSSVSSAAISIPPNLLAASQTPDLMSEIIRARRRRKSRVWTTMVLVTVGGAAAWALSKRNDLSAAIWGEHPAPAPVESAPAAPPPVAPPSAAPAPPPPTASTVVEPPPPARPPGKPLNVQALPPEKPEKPPAPAPIWRPRPRPQAPAQPQPPPTEDIPRNPYR